MSADFSDPATVFVVKDVSASVAHYRDVLGFTVDFSFGGDPPSFAGVYRGSVTIYLQGASETARPPGAAALCVTVDDADLVYDELRKSGANLAMPPETRDYGLRDFNVEDPDGNTITIGSVTEEA